MAASRPAQSRSNPLRVVARLTEDIQAQIRSGALAPGAALPSVRQLARERDISPFSAAEIFNALVASGAVEALPGRGYFVTRRRQTQPPKELPREFRTDSVWERRREAHGQPIEVDAGCGWLPEDWLHAEGVRNALRALAREPRLPVEGYGSPLGLEPLRAHLSAALEARGLSVRENQIALTQGASQALDLIVRECLKPGDVVVVEDPGYPPVFELLKAREVTVLSVPRNEDGPDVEALAQLVKRQRVRAFFTQTTCHNPTGTTISAAVAHRILELAHRHDVMVVEDDIFADLALHRHTPIACLDGAQRVVYVSSFSKTISPMLRAGYVVGAPQLIQRLARAKVSVSLGTSELLEQLLLEILTHGHYRRHLKRLRERLAATHVEVAREFGARGVELSYRPESGLFLWAKLPSRESVSKLWNMALRCDVLLAPGELYRPDGRATGYWRFNIAQCLKPRLLKFLDGLG